MKRTFVLLFFFFILCSNIYSQITLSHNVGITPIKTDWTSCEDEEYWARTFTLSEFGISTTDQFIIKSGQIAVSNSYDGARLNIGVLVIDSDFPNSTPKYLGGGSGVVPAIGDAPEIVNIEFFTPIVIPSNAKRILVVASQSDDIYNPDYKKVLIAGTDQDNDISWFQGCKELYTYTRTENLSNPKPNANFFINVTGDKLSVINSNSNIVLSHNIGDDVIKTEMYSCTSSYLYWARKFNLSEFKINENQELIISRGNVGITGAGWLATLQFNIYKVDENFPDSFSKDDLIGSSQEVELSPFSWNSTSSKIITILFEKSVVVPSDVATILVEVRKGISYGDANAFIAGTEGDTDSSWFRTEGCGTPDYETTQQMRLTRPNANFYITVNGEAKTIFPFEITKNNNCINFSNEFSLTNQAEIDTVLWNFDDPSTGVNNTSNSIDANHQFSSPEIYYVTAEVLHIDGTNYTIPKEIEIFDAPVINENVSLKQCDNSDINGFSFFNLNEVKEEIITNPENYTIAFFEERIDAENDRTPITDITRYKNQAVSVDKIWARVENNNGCYKISEVNLFVSTTQTPSTLINSFYQCDDGTNTTDGIASFDFSSATEDIKNIFPVNQQLIIEYYRNEVDALSEENAILDITNYQNIGYPNQQNIYIRVDSKFDNDCLSLGTHISLNVEKIPVANPVLINPECDNDRDGLFSFDTSTIENTITGTQTNVAVSYFDASGTQLASPLPNPFITASQNITAQITNTLSQDIAGPCADETILNFVVNSVPVTNTVAPLEACDDDTDGIIGFNTSTTENSVLGGQTGLIVRYFDENNTELSSPLPSPFFTASQKITVRLENPIYNLCYEETKIDFIVREKPTFNLIKGDIICMTSNPHLEIAIENPSGNNTYTWTDENNNSIGGDEETITITKGGIYKVIATSKYGCNSEEEEILIRESSLSIITINDIEVKDDSNNNNIQISAANLGLGSYQFRLLDENNTIVDEYQDEPYFDNLKGGICTIEVHDKNDCGAISFKVYLLEFPKFFTPNNDLKNDYWQIIGVSKNFYKSGEISIFNRYGKLITNFTIDAIGWDGTYNGKVLPSNDYWFYATLVDQKNISRMRNGNFSLIRK
jgi:gliding motility-associated-like protein